MPALDERTPAVKRAGRGSNRLAVADQLPEQVKAVIPVVTESALTLGFLREDTYELETPFSWGTVAGQERRAALLRQALGARSAERALFTRPCSQAGRLDLGPGHAKHYIGDGGTLYGTGSSACFDPLLGCAPRTAPAGHLSWSGALFLRLEESRLLRRVRHQKILGLLVVHGLIRR